MRTLANRDVQMGSTPSTPAALISDWSLSDCLSQYVLQPTIALGNSYGDVDTVIGEDEGRVGRCELGGRHVETFSCDVKVKVPRFGGRDRGRESVG